MACLAVTTAWLGQRYSSSRAENAVLRDQHALAELALQAARQQLEAERIIAARRLETADRQLTAANAQLAAAAHQLATASAPAEQAGQASTLSQRIDALAGSTQAGDDAQERLARLVAEFQSRTDLGQLKITLLASALSHAPQALGLAMWDSKKQEGVLKVEKLPALAADEDYQLWIVDPHHANPINGGVFAVDAQTGEARVTFKARQPIAAIGAFAVTRERKGGAAQAEGPFVLLGK